MTPGTWTLAGALALGLLGGGLAWRRSREAAPAVRVALLLGPVIGAAMLWMVAGFAIAVPNHSFSAARLALSTSLFLGHPLYPPEESGLLLCAIYGPVSVLAYLPAATLSNPSHALVAGGATNLLLFLGPLVVLFQRGASGARGLALACAAITAGLLATSEAMRQVLGSVHVDGTAIGLTTLSCAVLLGGVPGTRRLVLAAALVVLAAWTKQVEAPAALGQLLWLAVVHGRGTAARYLAALAGCAALSVLALGLAFGFSEVWLNVIRIPASHPLYALRPLGGEWARMSWPIGLLLGAAAWAERPERPGRPPLARDWGLLLAVSVLLVPTSLLARAKMGGFLNSWHSHFFLVAAAGMALRGALVRPRPGTLSPRTLGAVALVLGALLVAVLPWQRGHRTYLYVSEPTHMDELVDLAREHPGRVYLPWNPLATLVTDGRLYHFEWGVRDRDLAGVRPSDAHVRAHVPAGLELVVYPRRIVERESGPRLVLLEYLPEFSERVDLPGHPDLIGFRRPADAE